MSTSASGSVPELDALVKVFCVIDEVLSGELSCMWTGLVFYRPSSDQKACCLTFNFKTSLRYTVDSRYFEVEGTV